MEQNEHITHTELTEKPKNYLALNIVMAILGLCPVIYCLNFLLAVIGIFYAVQVNKKYEKGDVAGAMSASKTAKILGFCALGLFIIAIILVIITISSGEFQRAFEEAMQQYQ